MHKEKSHILYYSIKLGIFASFAIAIFILNAHIIPHLKYFIGGLMLTYGVEETLYEIWYHGKKFYKGEKTYLGLVEIVLGVTLLFVPFGTEEEEIIKLTCLVWAAWAILREAFEIKELVLEVKSITLTIISGIESVAAIVLSIMLMCEPGEHHALFHLYFLTLELILAPLVPLLDEIIEKKKAKKEEEVK